MQKLRLFPTVVMLIFLSFTACKTTKTTTSIPAPPPPPAAPAVVEAMPVVLTDAELAAKKDYSGTYPDVRAGRHMGLLLLMNGSTQCVSRHFVLPLIVLHLLYQKMDWL